MKKLKKILLILVIIIGIVFVVSLFLPSTAYLERSQTMKADASIIFEQVNDLKKWELWSPWHNLDPQMVEKYGEITSGKGATFVWESKMDNVGNGKMLITFSVPNDSIKLDFDFMDSGTSNSMFRFVQQGDSVLVTWSMLSHLGFNPISKYFGLFLDRMVGPDFEKGLLNLKKIGESTPSYAVNKVKLDKQLYIGIQTTCKPADIGSFMGSSYGAIAAYMGAKKIACTGAPIAVYNAFSEESVTLIAALPMNETAKVPSNMICGAIEAGNALVVNYYGAYDKSEPAHKAIDRYVEIHKCKIIGAPWEVYVTDPGMEKDTARWLTKIYYPIE